jgi:hypothetical protein
MLEMPQQVVWRPEMAPPLVSWSEVAPGVRLKVQDVENIVSAAFQQRK